MKVLTNYRHTPNIVCSESETKYLSNSWVYYGTIEINLFIGPSPTTLIIAGDHEWLLSDVVDILPHLLLPLAGPEEISEEDMDGLPDDLQYLDDDKVRESDPEIRKMLLEALHKVKNWN